VEFELVEALGSGLEAAYTKHPDLLQHNPKGLVPTLVIGNEVKCESLDILKELYSKQCTGNDKVFSRLHNEAMQWNRQICSPFYRVLMKPDEKCREQGWKDMTNGITAFSDRLLLQTDGSVSFYNYEGKKGNEPSPVDFAVFPFIQRRYIIEHYRGYRLEDGVAHEIYEKIKRWEAKMEALPSVAKTLADRQSLIDVYNRYADGTAQSKVGDAVRQGKEAHDIE
jgi:glutathione S-transferase